MCVKHDFKPKYPGLKMDGQMPNSFLNPSKELVKCGSGELFTSLERKILTVDSVNKFQIMMDLKKKQQLPSI